VNIRRIATASVASRRMGESSASMLARSGPAVPAGWGTNVDTCNPRRLDRQTAHRGAIDRDRCNPISGASPQRSVRSVDSCTSDRYSGCMQGSCVSEHLLRNRDRREWATRQLGGSVVRAITRQSKAMQSCTSVHTVATSIRGCELGDRATGLRRRRVTLCTTAAQTVGDKAVLHRSYRSLWLRRFSSTNRGRHRQDCSHDSRSLILEPARLG